MGMKILVTGGAGNIGSHVCAELVQHGHSVVSFDKDQPGARRGHRVNGVRYRVGDHEDLGQVTEVAAGMDAIAHLSAIPAPRTYPNTIVFRTNVMGTFNVHEAAVMVGVTLVVSTSSGSAYGFAWQHRPFLPKYVPMDEDHPDLAQDAYGLSKMLGEQIAHGFNRRCDLRVCSIRPPWVVLPDQYETAVRARVTRQRPGGEGWSGDLFGYVDVRDLATAYRLVLEAPPEVVRDEVYNVVADDAMATEPLAQLLPCLDPSFKELASGLTGNQSMVTAARIKQALGWQPRYSWRDVITL